MSEAKLPTERDIRKQLAERKAKKLDGVKIVEGINLEGYSIVEPFGLYMLPSLYTQLKKKLLDQTHFYNICFPGHQTSTYDRAGSVLHRFPAVHTYWCDAGEMLQAWAEGKTKVLILAPINNLEQYRLLVGGKDPIVDSGCKYLLFTKQKRAVEHMKKKLKYWRSIEEGQSTLFLFTNLPHDS